MDHETEECLRAHPEQCEIGSAVAPVKPKCCQHVNHRIGITENCGLWKNQSLPREATGFLIVVLA